MALKDFKKNNNNYLKAVEHSAPKKRDLNKTSQSVFIGATGLTSYSALGFLRASESYDFTVQNYKYTPSAWKVFDFSEPVVPEDAGATDISAAGALAGATESEGGSGDITDLLSSSFVTLDPGNPDLRPAFPIEEITVDPPVLPPLPEVTDPEVSETKVTFLPSFGLEDTAIKINVIVEDTSGGEDTIEIRIYNLPTDAILSAGTLVTDGLENYYLLTLEELNGLTITPPQDSSDNITLDIQVITTNPDGSLSSTQEGSVLVTVRPDADLPTAQVDPLATGDEDTYIPISIPVAEVNDLDGSETLEIRIFGVPEGSTLIGAVANGRYYRVTDKDSLQILPPANSSENFTLNIQFVVFDRGPDDVLLSINNETILTVDIEVNPIADLPTLTVSDASGLEDGAIALSINPALTDTDGSEELSITISGVPTGARLNAGIDNGDGSWTLTKEELVGLTITPPLNSDASFDLTVEAIATETENSDVASVTDTITVTVEAVADIPSLRVSDATGDEDTAIPLSITASLFDTDGSESLSISITNVPEGAILSAGTKNTDGSWTLTTDQLTGLTITPPLNSGDDFTLLVTATSTESANADTSSMTEELIVTVNAVADVPTLTVTDITLDEDTIAPLNLGIALTDTDGSEFIAKVIITKPDAEVSIVNSSGNPIGTDIGGNQIELTYQQALAAYVSPGTNSDIDFSLGVEVFSEEAENGDQASITGTINVTVNSIVDDLEFNSEPLNILEDTTGQLIISADLTDTDGSETVETVLTGIPVGVTLTGATDNGGGSWTVTDYDNLILTPIEDSDEDFTITITHTVTEAKDGSTRVFTDSLNVTIDAVADVPTLTTSDAAGDEDTVIPLTISSGLVDIDGSETLNITISNVPTGALLSAGTNNGGGSWTLTPDQLTGLTITPALNSGDDFTLQVTATSVEGANADSASITEEIIVTVNAVPDVPTLNVSDITLDEDKIAPLNLSIGLTDTDGSESIAKVVITKPNADVAIVNSSGVAIGTDIGPNQIELTYEEALAAYVAPPLNSDVDFSLGIEVFSEEQENGLQASTTGTITVSINSVVDNLIFSSEPLSILEDTTGQLVISAELTDTDGSESVVTVLTGIPAGATLSGATDNGDGSWTVTDYDNLILTPIANSDVDFTISITHTVTEAKNSATRVFNDSLNVTIDAVADTPILTTADATGDEDTAIPLSISASLVDTDGSETLRIGISNVPLNAVLSAGTNLGGGNWLLTEADLVGLTITPPSNLAGEVILTVRALATEAANSDNALAEDTLTVTVNAVADVPTLTVSDASGDEDTAISLNISGQLQDLDGSETISFLISDVPTGAVLSAGTDNGDGSWTLTQAQLVGLTITPPLNSDEDFILNVTVTATETTNNDFESVSASLNVTVNAVADTPTLTVSDASGDEDTAIALSITPALVDTDTSETLSITISGVPTGALLSAGTDNGDGSWSLTTDQLTGLTITPPLNSGDDFVLQVTATSTENENNDTASITQDLNVVVNAVADTPVFTMNDLTIDEDSSAFLSVASLDTASLDQDGSESYQYFVSGVPVGFIISNATDLGSGRWQLTGVPSASAVVPTPDFSGEVTLTLEIQTTESENNDTATGSDDFLVTVQAIADAPNLTVQDASGDEDTAIALDITSTLNDTDGSESLSITISGVPDGAILSAGTNNTDGSWILTVAQLTGLTITPPADSGENFELTVTATSTEASNNDTASTTATINVTVNPIADTPTVSADPVTTDEDTAAALNITTATTDVDGSEVINNITITDMPDGATLNAGTNNGDGSWTLSVADLSGLTITPPPNSDDDFTITITTNITDPGGTSNSASTTATITVNAVADIPKLTVADATGDEDTAIALTISGELIDTDLSETLSFEITGVPTGAVLSAGTDNGSGSWTLTAAQLVGLTITPPSNSDADFDLTVTATATESSNSDSQSVSATLSVTVNAVADIPTLTVDAASGNEDTAILLNISPALTDTDGSETLSVTIADVPTGATLSAGTNNGDGTWTLTTTELVGLSITPPLNSGDDFTLKVSANSTEGENSDTATFTQDLVVDVVPVADAPLLVVRDINATEDAPSPVNLGIILTDRDGSESISQVTITTSLLGVTFYNSDAQPVGVQDPINPLLFTFTAEEAADLFLLPPINSSLDFQLVVEAFSQEGENLDEASTIRTINVLVNSAVDDLIHSTEPLDILEDTSGTLIINAELTDTDGSEVLTTVITGAPIGTIITGATENPQGTWTVTDLNNLQITPPANSDEDFTLSIIHTVVETDTGESRIFNDTLEVTVNAVADTPNLTVSDATGVEDTPVAISISASLVDTDGSENLRIGISNVPLNATLSAGTNLGNGNWLLAPTDLIGLTLTPPEDLAGQVELTIRALATESENLDQALATETLIVTVNADADIPTLNLSDATGDEDTAIALSIGAQLQDLDGSETLSVVISDVPDGATLSAGTDNGDGSWTLTQAQLSGLTITPPLNSDENFSLTITATATEGSNNDTESVSGTINVTVNAVADAPTLTVADATGDEDTAIPLTISTALVDDDTSESVTITIAGVPIGATLSAGTNNGDGTWSLTTADLVGLTLTPVKDDATDFTLTVTATTEEAANGDRATTTDDILVTVNAVADTAVFTMQDITIDEDGSNFITFATVDPNSLDQDGSETYEYFVTGVPDGFTITNATDLGSGRWQTTGVPQESEVVPPEKFSGQITLTLEIVSTEDENADQATGTDDFLVTVEAVADIPNLTVEAASGDEDTAIALTITSSLNDTDGSEILSIIISDIPTGATLSAGTDNGDGSWTLTPDQLTGLTITPPLDSGADFDLTVTAVSTETSNSDTAETSATLSVTVRPIADIPTVSADAVTTDEDTAAALNITTATTDTDGSEVIDNITITNMPTGASLSAGTDNGDGSWTLTKAQLTGLTITPPPNSSDAFTITVTTNVTDPGGTSSSASTDVVITVNAIADVPVLNLADASGDEDTAIALSIGATLQDSDGSETLTYVISDIPTGAVLSAGVDNADGTWTLSESDLTGLTITPPLNSDTNFTLTVTATATESSNTDMASATGTLNVTVNAVADAPELTVTDITGNEDTAIALDITPALVDTDGSETLVITIANVPTGATLSAGTDNGDGTWTLTSAQLTGLTITPPLNSDVDFTLQVTATSVEGANSDTASTTVELNVTVEAVADAPILNLANVNATEDTPSPLNLNASLFDNDGSESFLKVIITKPSADISIVDTTGAAIGTDLGSNQIELTYEEALVASVLTAQNSDEDFQLQIEIFTQEAANGDTASATGVVDVLVTSQVDDLIFSSEPLTILEDTTGQLVINAELTDTDGSESLSTVLSGVPTGVTISGATDNGDGTWTVDDINNLIITPIENSDEDFTITITHTVTEAKNGATRDFTDTLNVTVDAVADTPLLTTQPASGDEDTTIALDISASLVDTDGSESLRIGISNVPLNATLSAGTNLGEGNWLLNPDDLIGLTINPPANVSGEVELLVSVLATEGENSDQALAQETLVVTVNAVADIPTLNVTDASGDEDTAIALTISADLADLDGSETLTFVIADIPAGATLSAGTDNGDGSWSLTQAELVGLTITPPLNSDDDFTLSVTATATEGANNDSQSVTESLNVTVNAVADVPTLTVADASGDEDTEIALSISSALTDTDGSEVLTLTISGVPTGAVLSAGTDNGDGSWTLTDAQLAGLTIIPPLNYSGSFDLTITSTTTEASNGDSASATDSITVTVDAVADPPIITASDLTTDEDVALDLNIAVDLFDTDGSETITSITISGFPSDGSVNQGTLESSADGFDTYTFTQEELAGLQYTPSLNSDEDFILTITANTEDENGTTNSATQDINVTVNAVADNIEVNAEGGRTEEDSSVGIKVGFTQFDTDGSEVVTIEATVLDGSKFNVPDDQIISTGPTVYVLTPDQLEGLIYSPPPDFGGTAQITFTAITTEQSNGDFQSDSVTIDVIVEPIADIPTLTNNGSEGDEDTDIPLNMVAEAGDVDGSETVYVRVDNLPNGATMSGGTLLDDDSYVFTQEEFNNATIRPPLNSDEDFDIEITIVVQDSNGDQLEEVFTETIIVNPVNDGIELTGSASDEEDKLIPLNAKIVFIDDDKSEIITKVEVTIPAGYELETDKDKFPAEDADRVVEIEEGSVDTIKVRPPLNSNVDFVIPITFTTQEVNGGELVQTIEYPVDLVGKVDQPTFTINELNILEDSTEADAANQFIINFDPATVDSDGSETYEYTFSNVPDGVTLSAGTYIGDGKWIATADEINNLFIIPSKDSNGSYDIRLDIKITENDGDTATVNQNFKVNVEAVADTPSLAVADNYGNSATNVKLNIIGELNDTDGSETLTFTITASDAGTFVDSSGNPVGTQDTTNPLKYTFTQAQATDLFFNYAIAGVVTFEVVAEATESSNSDIATTTETLQITYYDGGNTGDTGIIDVLANDLTTCEDENVQLEITLIQEQIEAGDVNSVTLSNLPTGTEIVDSTGTQIGTDNGSGSWTLTDAQLADAYIKLPADYAENFVVDVTYNKTDGSSGIDQSTSDSFNVFVKDVQDFPIITDSTASITEDVWGDLNLDIDAVSVDDNAVVIVEGLPDGAIFNAGLENNDGTWTLNAQDLPTLQVLTKEHDSTDFVLRFEWQIQAVPGCEPSPEDLEAFVTVNVNEVADPVSMNDVVATPNEDEKKRLEFDLELIDRDGSETITSIVITSFPQNGTLTNVNEDGTVEKINEIDYTPNPNFNGTDYITIEVTVVDNDGEDDGTEQSTYTTVKTVAINVLPRTDDARQQFEDLTTLEDTPVAIIVDFRDSDLGQDYVYEMTGIPEGSVLSAGINQGGGKWIVVNDEIDGLTITPPLHYSGKFTVDVKTFTEDSGNGDIKDHTENFDVVVEAVADAPEGAGLAVVLTQGEDAQLFISGELIDTDGSEILSFEIDGLPDGATLSKGSYDDVNDVWTLKADEIQDLFITDTEAITDDFVITARAIATEDSNKDTAFSEFSVNVTFVPSTASSPLAISSDSSIEAISTTSDFIADAPTLEVEDVIVGSSSQIARLNINSHLTDDNEVLSFEISNLPEGVEVNAGFFDNANSKWILDSDDINNLELTGLDSIEQNFNFQITAISIELDSGDFAFATEDITVNFNHQNFHQMQAMIVNMEGIESNTTDELASYESNVDEFGDIYIAETNIDNCDIELNETEEDLSNSLVDSTDHDLIIENDKPIVI